MEKFLSLYDFLHRAAGQELGKQVQAAAKAAKIPVEYKQVNNRTYSGRVNMYPESWLRKYFNKPKPQSGTEVIYNEPDDLPF